MLCRSPCFFLGLWFITFSISILGLVRVSNQTLAVKWVDWALHRSCLTCVKLLVPPPWRCDSFIHCNTDNCPTAWFRENFSSDLSSATYFTCESVIKYLFYSFTKIRENTKSAKRIPFAFFTIFTVFHETSPISIKPTETVNWRAIFPKIIVRMKSNQPFVSL